MAEGRPQNGDASSFLRNSGGSSEILLDNSIPEKTKKYWNSPLYEFETSILLNELMIVRQELKVLNDNLVCARDFA